MSEGNEGNAVSSTPSDQFVPPDEIVEALDQVEKGDTKELTGGGALPVFVAISGAGAVTPAEDLVEFSDGAVARYEQLSDEDRAAVRRVAADMKSPDFDGGVLLGGSSDYFAVRVNDHLRLVYRPRIRGGYSVLNIVIPESTLWRMTEHVL
jgi:hypothetical protein